MCCEHASTGKMKGGFQGKTLQLEEEKERKWEISPNRRPWQLSKNTWGKKVRLFFCFSFENFSFYFLFGLIYFVFAYFYFAYFYFVLFQNYKLCQFAETTIAVSGCIFISWVRYGTRRMSRGFGGIWVIIWGEIANFFKGIFWGKEVSIDFITYSMYGEQIGN